MVTLGSLEFKPQPPRSYMLAIDVLNAHHAATQGDDPRALMRTLGAIVGLCWPADKYPAKIVPRMRDKVTPYDYGQRIIDDAHEHLGATLDHFAAAADECFPLVLDAAGLTEDAAEAADFSAGGEEPPTE